MIEEDMHVIGHDAEAYQIIQLAMLFEEVIPQIGQHFTVQICAIGRMIKMLIDTVLSPPWISGFLGDFLEVLVDTVVCAEGDELVIAGEIEVGEVIKSLAGHDDPFHIQGIGL